jgi:hypothetical protein
MGMRMRAMIAMILATSILALAASTDAHARGGLHGHSGGHSHGHFRHARQAPANPSVPPSLTSDPRVTGDAPLPAHRQPKRGNAPVVTEKRDPEDVALDRKIKSICRGC